MRESSRRLTAIRTERARVAIEARQWRARATSFELALAIEGNSTELRKRRDFALGKANGLDLWLAQVQRTEQTLTQRVGEKVA